MLQGTKEEESNGDKLNVLQELVLGYYCQMDILCTVHNHHKS